MTASLREEAQRGGDPAAASIRTWIAALRPLQWIKNGFVLTPLLFSGRALEWAAQQRALLAFAAFSLLASGVYLLNDVADRHSDRLHPVKQMRPVASGAISPAQALTASALLVAVGLGLGLALGWRVATALVVYFILNVAYSLVLKTIVIIDVFVVASFFIIRLAVGAAAIDVEPSIWLLLCGGLLALYLGFAKRRHELVVLGDGSPGHRVVLAKYNMPFLDQLSAVLLAVTVVSYINYTLESATARRLESDALSYSTVFVLYGVFRYLYLVHRREGGDPAETLLADPSLLAAVSLWGLYCGTVLYFG